MLVRLYFVAVALVTTIASLSCADAWSSTVSVDGAAVFSAA